MTRSLTLVVGLLFTLVFGYLALRDAQWGQLMDASTALSLPWISVAVGALALDYALRALRWQWMLRSLQPSITWRKCLGPMLGSFALNNILPLRAGDAVRAFAFHQRLKVEPAAVLSSLILERLFDLLGLLLFFYLGSQVLMASEQLLAIRSGVNLVALSGLTALIILLFLPAPLLRQLQIHGNPKHPLQIFLVSSLQAIQAMGGPRLMLRMVLCTALIWSLEMCVFIAAAAAAGVGLNLSQGAAVMALGTLSTLLPSSPGYLGTFDYFTRMGFEFSGVEAATALTTTLLVHLVLWLPITLVGLGWLWKHWGGSLLLRVRDSRKLAERT